MGDDPGRSCSKTMNDLHSPLPRNSSEDRFLGLALSLGIFTTLTALALYAYLGTFSRYSSDDYCLSAFFLTDDFLRAMIQRYFISSSRYTNILFIGLSDRLFGWYNVAILPALMLCLFVCGLYLLLKEVSEILHLRWSRGLVLFLALLTVYFSITQAPDLYETLYWRAGMTSHFAPVVFMPFWGAFLLRHIRNATGSLPSLWAQAACFLIPFVIGGLSEPPTALMITILGLGILAAWRSSDLRNRRSILILLSWSLVGAVMALLVMGLAPANSLRMQTPPPPLLELISKIIYYPSFFVTGTLRTLPTPTLISIVVLAVLFYVKYGHPAQGLSRDERNRLGLLMLILLVLAYLLIAASFAPSVYGQSYPVPRARFAARVIMTAALLAEGALIGVLAAGVKVKSFQPAALRNFAILVLVILTLYPLRAAWRTYGEIPLYRQSAVVWDAREAQILAMKAQGEQDLVVPFLSEVPIQDLGDHKGYRLNRCAAALYGVNSIVAVPIESE
jgi:hypothetical protein